MDSIRELSQSISGYLRGRFSNPLFGAYIFAWCAINFRLILAIFDSTDAPAKIKYIDTVLYPCAESWIRFGVLYPLLAAVVLVLTMPIFGRWITSYLRSQEKATVSKLLEIEGVTPLDPEKASELRRSIIQVREERRREREALEANIAELSQQIESLITQNLALKNKSGDATWGPTEEEGEEPEDTPEELPARANDGGLSKGDPVKKNLAPVTGSYVFSEGDFIGVNQRTVLRIVTRGVSDDQANALYLLRNGGKVRSEKLGELLGLEETFQTQLLLDQLQSLELVEKGFAGSHEVYGITRIGRQVVAALKGKGFSPPEHIVSVGA